MIQDKIKNFLDEATDADLKKLEMMLKSHDWFFDFTEDPRVWRKGRAERDTIRNMVVSLRSKGLSKEVEALWKKHAPKQFQGK